MNKANSNEAPIWEETGIDFINEFYNMNKVEQTIVTIMKDLFKWDKELNSFNYEVSVQPNSIELLERMKYETFLKGYNTLFKRDLMRRTKRHHYMLNPAFFIPTGEASTYFELLWSRSTQHTKEQSNG